MLRAAETTSRTDTGLQRGTNEDAAFARAPVFVVADGMGGAQAGEVASQTAVEVFAQGLDPDGTAEHRLATGAREANRRIHALSRESTERAGMGTTLTAAYLDGDDLAIAHVGDSRAYLFRRGELRRLTQDHTLVGALVRDGKLTEEQAAEHPQRSIITRALGPEPSVDVDTWSYPLRAGDVILLCSDGLTSMVPEEKIASVLASTHALDRAAEALIAEANAAGGRDNITVVAFRAEEVGGGADADQPTLVGMALPAQPTDAPAARPASPRNPAPPPADPAMVTVIAPAITPAARPAPAQEPPAPARPARLARTQGPGPQPATPPRRRGARVVAAIVATSVVLFMVGAGGWLATRQLFFIGTNTAGLVTIYRGLPYDLPGGFRLYESFYVSGVAAASVPAERRAKLLDHHLRSQNDASGLVRDLELGRVAK